MIDQAPIVRYTASVSENFFLILGERLFQQNLLFKPDLTFTPPPTEVPDLNSWSLVLSRRTSRVFLSSHVPSRKLIFV